MTSPLNREEIPDNVYYAVDAELTALVLRVVAPFEANLSVKNVKDRDYAVSRLLQLITIDRKRVALEARISELKMWELPENEIQMVFANPCNICGHDYPKLRKAQQDRLSALKAQQEEV